MRLLRPSILASERKALSSATTSIPARLYFEQHLIQWDVRRISAAFGAPPSPCMVHQNIADHLCAKREEMSSVFASDSPCARELKVDLISQRGGFQTVSDAPSQILPRDPPEFRI